MKHIRLINKKIGLVLFSVVCLCLIIFIQSSIMKISNGYEKIELNTNWDFELNGEKESNITLSEYSFRNTMKGDSIVLTRLLPIDRISHPALVLRLYHCAFSVKIDGKEIYEYGHSIASKGDAVGSGKYIVALPKGYEGKRLELFIDVCEDDSFPNIEIMSLQNEVNYVSNILKENMLSIVTSVFMTVFGIVGIFIVLINGDFSKQFRRLLWIGSMSLCFGIWTLADSNFMELFVESRTTISRFLYLGLFLATPSTIMFCFESRTKKNEKRIFALLFICSIVLIIAAIICNETNISHLASFLTYSHIYTGITIVMLTYSIFFEYRKKPKSEKILITGLGFMIGISTLEIIRFNVLKYLSKHATYISILPISITIFVVVMIFSYIGFLKEYMSEAAEKKILSKLAYSDMLTGISNRARCEEYMNEMDKRKIKEYAIVNFDLNYLKMINDNHGHLAGDRYICEFAQILEEQFSDKGVIGRMGGDEFIAIVRKEYINDIAINIMKMIEKAEEDDVTICNQKLSFAYGYVVCTPEKRKPVWKTYEEADKKMYECKQKQKADRN